MGWHTPLAGPNGTSFITCVGPGPKWYAKHQGDPESDLLGAAFHAGLATGLWSGLDGLPDTFAGASRFEPRMESAERQRLIAGWKDAVRRTLP